MCKRHQVNIGNIIEVSLIVTRNVLGAEELSPAALSVEGPLLSPSPARKRGQTIRRVCWISAISDSLLGTSDIRKAWQLSWLNTALPVWRISLRSIKTLPISRSRDCSLGNTPITLERRHRWRLLGKVIMSPYGHPVIVPPRFSTRI